MRTLLQKTQTAHALRQTCAATTLTALAFSVFLCAHIPFTANADDRLIQPTTSGVPGEMGHLFLNRRALILHPFTNDTAGATDKFFTFGCYAGIMGGGSGFGYELKAAWRMLTPSFQDKRDVTPLRKVPIGRYADWAETQAAFAYTFRSGYGLALNYGVGRAGGHYARDVQHWWHSRLGVKSNKRLKWDDQLTGRRDSYGGEFRIAERKPLFFSQQLLAVGYQKNLVIEEIFARGNGVWGKAGKRRLACATEVLAARPLRGELFTDYHPFRYEASLGCRLASSFSPAVKYVSPYVKGDTYPQIYVTLFNYQREF